MFEMPFTEHLAELRTRLIRIILGVVIGALFAFWRASDIFSALCSPLHAHFNGVELIGTGPAEAFIVKLKMSIAGGFLLSIPWTFYQLWQFISPGLHRHEKRFAIPFVLASSLFFLAGAAFCFYGVLPFAFRFFALEFGSIGVEPKIRIGEYLSFAIRLLFVFGLVFELPVLSFFLARIGLITHNWLIKKFRIMIVLSFICAAILTPPDVATQTLLAIPLILLYGLCILVAYWVGKKKPIAADRST